MSMKKWTSKEVIFLMENFRKYKDEYLAEVLGRTPSQISNKRFALGLTLCEAPRRAHPKFTPDQDALIRQHYALISDVELSKMIGCTPKALNQKAYRLGLRKIDIWKRNKISYRPAVFWNTERKDFLKANFRVISDDELAEHFNTTPNAIRSQAWRMGLAFHKMEG